MLNNHSILNRFSFRLSREWQLILLFAAAKLLIHFFTYSNYELHRDAYLYYAQSEHLAWGYFSAPPLLAVIVKIATLIFGNTAFGLRLIPALFGAFNIIILGLVVRELGGKTVAISLGCLAYLLSPAYLHVNSLLQPVSLNHFFWLLSGYLILLMTKRNDPKIWVWLAIVFGFGFIGKYAIVFYFAAIAIALLLTENRRLYFSKYFLIALPIGILIVLPNLIWQGLNHWPIVVHMSELRESQLVHVKISDFLFDQILMNAHALILWAGAVLILVFKPSEKPYRVFGYIFLIVILLLMLGSGKSYYTLGAYPILFAFGGYFVEKFFPKYSTAICGTLVVFMFIGLYISLSIDGIPFITFERALKKDGYRWEDGEKHDLPQDLADMTGWKEIGQSVAGIYQDLRPDEQDNCDIYCYHYGQAGAVMFYGKKAGVPQPISYNDSFSTWSPDSLTKDYLIWVHSGLETGFDPDTLLPHLFGKVTLKSIIDNPYFRENGTKIYLCQTPTTEVKDRYKHRIKDARAMSD